MAHSLCLCTVAQCTRTVISYTHEYTERYATSCLILCVQSSSSFELRIKKMTEDLEVVRRTTTENEGVVGKLRAEVRELTEKNRLLVVEVLSCATSRFVLYALTPS